MLLRNVSVAVSRRRSVAHADHWDLLMTRRARWLSGVARRYSPNQPHALWASSSSFTPILRRARSES